MGISKDKISTLIIKANIKNASDLYIRENYYPYIRNNVGKIEVLETSLIRKEDISSFYDSNYVNDWIDFSYTIDNINCRCHSYYTVQGSAIAIRLLPKKIPMLRELGLPESVNALLDKKSGMIIVSGPTGSGKSTTLASFINAINMKHSYHIVTLENPVEYIIKDNKSIISQVEVNRNTYPETFSEGVKHAMRENPDVIMIGEIRTLEDIKTALFAAESGHLVLTTLHSSNVVDALDRLLNYEEKLQLKNMFANTFQAVIAQNLILIENKKVLCCEICLRSPATVSCIKNDTYSQLMDIMRATPGMMTMDDCMKDLKNTIKP